MTKKEIAEKGTNFQTDKFILKLAKKEKNWYVALMDKSTKEMIVRNFGSNKTKANDFYFSQLSIPKEPELKVV